MMEILMIILVSLTIAEMMFAMGLRLSFRNLVDAAGENPWLVTRAVVANYLVIPLITLLVIGVFRLSPMVGAGLLILAVAPAAPYGPPFTAIARGNLALSTGLMVLLAGSSAFMVPLLLHICLPLIANGNQGFRIDPLRMIGTLFFIQLFPLCAGLAIGQWRPKLASALSTPASHISKVMNGFMIISLAALQFRVFRNTEAGVILIMILLVIAALLTGWITGWPGKKNRIAVSVITAMRNMSLSMGIAAASFPGTPVVTTVMIFSFITGLAVLVFALILRILDKGE
jgi:bile acid:Na+ symporter, BASS family